MELIDFIILYIIGVGFNILITAIADGLWGDKADIDVVIQLVIFSLLSWIGTLIICLLVFFKLISHIVETIINK